MFGHVAVAQAESRAPTAPLSSLQSLESTLYEARALVASLSALANPRPARIEAFNLADLLRQSARLLKHALGSRIELHLDARTDPSAMALADASHVRHALLLLAAGAHESLTDAGRFSVMLSQHADSPETLLTIHIHMQAYPRRRSGDGAADEPVAWAHAQDIEPIVRSRVEAMRGRVEFIPHSPREIRVELQLPGHAREDSPSPPARQASGLIIVAESRSDVRSVLVSMLTSLNYQVAAVENLTAAIEAAGQRAAEVSLVILDDDGLDCTSRSLTERLRAQFGSTPLLLLTSGALLSDPGRDPTPFVVLQKPFRRADLAAAVARAIASRPALD